MIQPLLIEWLWRWELPAADERGLQPRRCKHRGTLFGAENTMNIERAKGVGHGRLYSGISHTKTFIY
jgi:hypothetical protein